MQPKENISSFIPSEIALVIRTIAEARSITVSEAVYQILLKGLPYWQGTSEGRKRSNREYQTRKRASLRGLRAGDHILLPDDSEGILIRIRGKEWDARRVTDWMWCSVRKDMIRFLPEPKHTPGITMETEKPV